MLDIAQDHLLPKEYVETMRRSMLVRVVPS